MKPKKNYREQKSKYFTGKWLKWFAMKKWPRGRKNDKVGKDEN